MLLNHIEPRSEIRLFSKHYLARKFATPFVSSVKVSLNFSIFNAMLVVILNARSVITVQNFHTFFLATLKQFKYLNFQFKTCSSMSAIGPCPLERNGEKDLSGGQKIGLPTNG